VGLLALCPHVVDLLEVFPKGQQPVPDGELLISQDSALAGRTQRALTGQTSRVAARSSSTIDMCGRPHPAASGEHAKQGLVLDDLFGCGKRGLVAGFPVGNVPPGTVDPVGISLRAPHDLHEERGAGIISCQERGRPAGVGGGGQRVQSPNLDACPQQAPTHRV
jgi:hypothetical protein